MWYANNCMSRLIMDNQSLSHFVSVKWREMTVNVHSCNCNFKELFPLLDRNPCLLWHKGRTSLFIKMTSGSLFLWGGLKQKNEPSFIVSRHINLDEAELCDFVGESAPSQMYARAPCFCVCFQVSARSRHRVSGVSIDIHQKRNLAILPHKQGREKVLFFLVYKILIIQLDLDLAKKTNDAFQKEPLVLNSYWLFLRKGQGSGMRLCLWNKQYNTPDAADA